MLEKFHQQAAELAAKKMFQGSHFSICDLDKLIELIGCIPNTKDYQALRCLHCVNWGDMSPELRTMVMEKVIQILQTSGFDVEILNGRLLHAQKQLNH